jgi:aspartate/methionine/tyrosine aminotransferase
MTHPFSSRVSDIPPENRLARAVAEARAAGREILDLTVSNPTVIGLDYPFESIAQALARGAKSPYEPEPLGIPSARRIVAARLGCDPDDIVITASTSEAYAFLFKLLADPGDEILTARPAYPLLDHLAAIESCRLRQFPLTYEPGSGWTLDVAVVAECLTDSTRAVVIVSPNNPTGSFVAADEARALAALCADRGITLVSDEVFLSYPLDREPAPSLGDLDLPCLTFSLGGLSKQFGMPQLKLGWIRVSGPGPLKRQAIAGLELIADNFLSVAAPVQAALGDLLAIGDAVRGRISERTHANLATLRQMIAPHPQLECLPVHGGWSAVLRVPAVMPDEELTVRILEETDVLVHPGHFFDFEREGFLVVSLLAGDFRRGMERAVALERRNDE